ncbi:MAG: ZIP family metal transporter [Promethearchaeota archaeon]
MAPLLAYGFLSILIVSALSLVGVLFLSIKPDTVDKILFYLVSFATGTILATGLFDLLPEAVGHFEDLASLGANVDELAPFVVVMLGFVTFYLLERFVYWFHGHAHERDGSTFACHCELPDQMLKDEEGQPLQPRAVRSFVYLNLLGDGLHNFLDGVVIMVSFLSGGVSLGVIVTLAVMLHELPQEIGDFGILVYGGLTKRKALVANFASALVALAGGLLATLVSGEVEAFNASFLAFSAGGFFYIGASELLPELSKERNRKKSVVQVLVVVSGILLVLWLIEVLPHE